MRHSLAFLLFCAACDSPSLSMIGVPAERVEADGMAFSVRLRDDRAEAIRTSHAFLPSKKRVFDAAGIAVAQVSGCHVERLEGDQAVVLAKLDCS